MVRSPVTRWPVSVSLTASHDRVRTHDERLVGDDRDRVVVGVPRCREAVVLRGLRVFDAGDADSRADLDAGHLVAELREWRQLRWPFWIRFTQGSDRRLQGRAPGEPSGKHFSDRIER